MSYGVENPCPAVSSIVMAGQEFLHTHGIIFGLPTCRPSGKSTPARDLSNRRLRRGVSLTKQAEQNSKKVFDPTRHDEP